MASVPVLARWFGRSISEATDLTIEDQLLMTKHLKGTLITKEVNETIMNLELSLGTRLLEERSGVCRFYETFRTEKRLETEPGYNGSDMSKEARIRAASYMLSHALESVQWVPDTPTMEGRT